MEKTLCEKFHCSRIEELGINLQCSLLDSKQVSKLNPESAFVQKALPWTNIPIMREAVFARELISE